MPGDELVDEEIDAVYATMPPDLVINNIRHFARLKGLSSVDLHHIWCIGYLTWLRSKQAPAAPDALHPG